MKKISLFILALSFATSSHAESKCGKAENYPVISKAELTQVVKKKEAFIVDVNSLDSFKEIHVPGAIHFGSHQKDFASLLPKDKGALLVAYCGGPSCGAWMKAAKEACKLGYTNIQHFKEGIAGWKAN